MAGFARRSHNSTSGTQTLRVDYGCLNREKGPLFVSGVRRQSNPKPPAQAAGALLGTSRRATTNASPKRVDEIPSGHPAFDLRLRLCP